MLNLRTKLLIPTLMMALLAVLSIVYISVLQYRSMQRMTEERIAHCTHDLYDFIENLQTETRHTAELLSNKRHFMDSVVSKNMDARFNDLTLLHQHFLYDFIAVYDKEGITIARGDAPDRFGTRDGLYPTIKKAADGKTSRSLVTLYDNNLLLWELKRLDAGNGPVGFLAVGKYLDEKMANHFLWARDTTLAFQYEDAVVVSSSNFKPTEIKDKNRFQIELADRFDQNPPFSAILWKDASSITSTFWKNLLVEIFIIGLISCVIIFFSRKVVVDTANALNKARVSAEKEVIKREQAQKDLQDLNDELEKRVKERTQNLEDQIAARKQAEKEIRGNEAYLRSVFRAAPTGIGVVGNRVIQKVNDRLCEMTGYSRDEIVGKSARFLYLSDEEFEYVEREKYAQIEKSGTGTVETRFKKKDGKRIDVLLSSTPINMDDLTVGVTFTALDISKQKRSKSLLLESEEKYRSIMEAMKDPLYICSADFEVEYMNPAMIKRVGGLPTGGKCYKTIHNLDAKCPDCMHDSTQKGHYFESDIISPKDNRSYHVSHSPIVHDNGTISKMTVYRDITAINQMEDQLRQAQKMEAIGTLAGGIAHDFNNILFPIFGYLEMGIEDVSKDDPLHTYLEEVLNGAKRARDLVQQILTFSRQSEHVLRPLKAQLIIKEALKLLKSSLPSTIKIVQSIQKDCGLVLADPIHIHQIIMNLCTNAFHAMEDDGGTLTINLKEMELTPQEIIDSAMTPGPHLCLTVADTGTGIDQGVMERIFDPYFTTKNESKGTGLGLAVISGIVKSHGGQITVDSKPGKGSEFKICLPVIKSDQPARKIEIDSPIQKGNEKILLVDDEDPIIQMEKQMLERLGYRITSRTSSIEALKAFKAQPDKFDLVITDLTMPNMTGDKLARELMTIRPDIPVILCTGFSEIMSKEKTESLGCKGFLLKPIVLKELAGLIRSVLAAENEKSNTEK